MEYGWHANDPTVILWNASRDRRPWPWRRSRWRAFLHGYREVLPLPEEFGRVLPLSS